MPREKEGFRDQMERLDARFPDKELLTRADVIVFTGRGKDFVDANIPMQGRGHGKYISKVALARVLT
jgi:hypothetical protein